MGSAEECAEKYPDGVLFISFCFFKHQLSEVFNICSQVPSDSSVLIEFTRAQKGKISQN